MARKREPTLCRSDFSDIDVELTDRVALELAPYALAVFDVRKPRTAMSLKAAVRRRAGSMRYVA